MYYHPSLPEPIHGREAHRDVLEGHVDSFSDYRIEKIRSFGQWDFVCAEWMSTATETSSESGERFRFDFCGVFEIRGGRIARLFEYVDREGHPV